MTGIMQCVLLSVLFPVLTSMGEEMRDEKKGGVDTASAESLYDITVKDNGGKEVKLSKYKGEVLLVVNVASK